MARRNEITVTKVAETKKHLDQRVNELARRAHLTPHEQTELAELKKQKLVLKDQLNPR